MSFTAAKETEVGDGHRDVVSSSSIGLFAGDSAQLAHSLERVQWPACSLLVKGIIDLREQEKTMQNKKQQKHPLSHVQTLIPALSIEDLPFPSEIVRNVRETVKGLSP